MLDYEGKKISAPTKREVKTCASDPLEWNNR